MAGDITIRAAAESDLERVTAIYNHYVTETHITFDTEPFTPEQRRPWFAKYKPSGRHRLFVAEGDGCVLGYTCSSPFSDRHAYDTTVEATIICAPESVGQRIGRLLYGALFDALAAEDVHTAIARVSLPNRGSAAIHEHFGFRDIGVIRQAGFKFGQYWDVGMYQKMMRGER
jgi:phosphinothricin acetyltransferase